MTLSAGRKPARFDCDGSTVWLELAGQRYQGTVERAPNGQWDCYEEVRQLVCTLPAAAQPLANCVSCRWFRFSGMTRDMSAGCLGYCGLVGFRNPRGKVAIDHGCGEHVLVAGWPADDEAAWDARDALSSQAPRPAREAAFGGALLGLAIGDALGYPCEFRRREAILAAFGPAGVTELVEVHDPRWPARPMIIGKRHPAGSYTDDTQMSIAVAEALLGGETELEPLMAALGQRFVAWSRSPDNNRSPGETCMTGCRNLARGVPWRQAGVAASKGCGSAMRVAPIGLRFWRERERLLELARASSLPTHGHDAALEGAAAAALLVALALEKATPQAMYEAVAAECCPRSADFAACWAKLPRLLEAPPEEALSEEGLGEGWVAEEAVASALYCFWRSPTDYVQTVVTAANTDGDSDSIACIAGGISGAFNGEAALPQSWKEGVENAAGLRELAAALAALAA